MFGIFVVAFAVIAISIYGFFSNADTQFKINEANILAEQMIYYHSAAARTCRSECSGAIDPRSELSTSKQGQGIFANGSFVSYATDDYVVTYYHHPAAGYDAEFSSQYQVNLSAALARIAAVDTGVWIGPYDRDAGRLETRIRRIWKDPITNEIHQPTATDITLANPEIPDGAPVIVNRK